MIWLCMKQDYETIAHQIDIRNQSSMKSVQWKGGNDVGEWRALYDGTARV